MRNTSLGFVLALAVLLYTSCGQTASAGMGALDSGITEIKKANITIADIARALNDVKSQLDSGEYREQVEVILRTASGAVEVGGQALLDFTRARVIEDLGNLKNLMLGREAARRVPVLANPSAPAVSIRHRPNYLTIVGWNLDVAQQNPNEFFLEVENAREPSRKADPANYSFNGAYAITLDLSPSGLPLRDWDNKLVFRGFSPVFEVSLVDSSPIVPERLTTLTGHLKTTNQDREGGLCRIELKDGPTLLWSHAFPEYPPWGDHFNQPLSFSIDCPVPQAPQFVVILSQEGAKERNILWRFEARAELRGNNGTTIIFDQSGLQLRCGDENPATVATTVARVQ